MYFASVVRKFVNSIKVVAGRHFECNCPKRPDWSNDIYRELLIG